MEIKAVAYYKYNLGDPGWENLQLVVKFRHGRKIVRTKLIYMIASMSHVENPDWFPDIALPYKTKDEYYHYINTILNNQDFKKEKTKELIRNWIDNRKEEFEQNNELKNIIKKVKDEGRTEIRVKIK